jgi:hypothetical protein
VSGTKRYSIDSSLAIPLDCHSKIRMTFVQHRFSSAVLDVTHALYLILSNDVVKLA